VRALRDEVLSAIGSRNLVDVRSLEEFSGKLRAPAHMIQEAARPVRGTYALPGGSQEQAIEDSGCAPRG
jgi:3-mercaptopyruvate sulfurtransferase SseA